MIADSLEQGWTVVRERSNVDIFRTHKRTGRILEGIRIWEDGGCTRLGMDLTMCKNIRTLTERRSVLGLS